MCEKMRTFAAMKKPESPLWRHPVVWLRRFRHRCGYGVHSPFAFDFLTNVVYERGVYYAYSDLDGRFPVRLFRRHVLKCRRFLFRLANYVHPGAIRLYGCWPEAEVAFLSAGCVSARVCPHMSPCRAGGRRPGAEAGEVVLDVVGADVPVACWKDIAGSIAEGRSVCVLAGIHASAEARRQWEAVRSLPEAVVTFDLYDYGLVFYDRSKQRQHYIVKF